MAEPRCELMFDFSGECFLTLITGQASCQEHCRLSSRGCIPGVRACWGLRPRSRGRGRQVLGAGPEGGGQGGPAAAPAAQATLHPRLACLVLSRVPDRLSWCR